MVGSDEEERQRRDNDAWPPSINSVRAGVLENAATSRSVWQDPQAQTILFLSGQVAYTPDGGVVGIPVGVAKITRRWLRSKT